jgi:hypothetical protein
LKTGCRWPLPSDLHPYAEIERDLDKTEERERREGRICKLTIYLDIRIKKFYERNIWVACIVIEELTNI